MCAIGAVVVAAVIIVCCAIICCVMKKQEKPEDGTQLELSAATTTAPAPAFTSPAVHKAEPLVPTSPVHVAVAIAEPAPAAAPANVDSGTSLQAELSELKIPELRKRAAAEGIAEDTIEVRVLSHTAR